MIIIVQTFVRHTLSASELNPRSMNTLNITGRYVATLTGASKLREEMSFEAASLNFDKCQTCGKCLISRDRVYS